MPLYILRVARYSYYRVEAPLLKEAVKILENCEDTAEFEATQDYQTLEDLDPRYELVGIREKADD
jgi:hypothetical protein